MRYLLTKAELLTDIEVCMPAPDGSSSRAKDRPPRPGQWSKAMCEVKGFKFLLSAYESSLSHRNIGKWGVKGVKYVKCLASLRSTCPARCRVYRALTRCLLSPHRPLFGFPEGASWIRMTHAACF